MQYVSMAIVGGIVGWLALAILPGNQDLGLIKTILLGIAGSYVGGIIGRFLPGNFGGSAEQPLHPSGFLMSIVGAFALIILLHSVLKLV